MSRRTTAGSMPVTPTAAMSAGRDAARAQKLAHDFADVAPPLLGIFLGPADMVGAQARRGARRGRAFHPAAG